MKPARMPLLVLVPVLFAAAGGCRRAPNPPPAVTVTASYPGANAAVVADTLAAPIEEQVNGAEGMVRMASRSDSDGSYTLTVTFQPGTDLDIAQVLVQNRVSLALPLLPDAVKRLGVAVKKDSPGVLLFVNLYAPQGRYDALYLGNYAATQLKDELNRLPGVLDVVVLGERDYTLRVWLDPDRLAARNLTAADVVEALKGQNVQAAAGQIGSPPANGSGPLAFNVTTLGRLADPEQLADLIVKTDGKGQSIRLKDVARVELEASRDSRVTLDSVPGAALAIYPAAKARPGEVSAAVLKKMAELKEHFPEGLDYAVVFDFTPNLEAPGRATNPEYLLVDVTLPALASPARIDDALKRCETRLRGEPGVAHTLALSDNPFDRVRNRPCVLVGLAAADGKRAGREQILAHVRSRLGAELPGALVRLRDLAGPGRFPRCGYPIDLAVSGPEADRVRELAEELAGQMAQDRRLTDVLANPDAMPSPQLSIDIDREQARARGVALADVNTTLQATLGVLDINDSDRFGRTWQVRVRGHGDFRAQVSDLKQLKVRNNRGEMVPLASVAAIREISGPLAIDRLDLRPAVEITANPAAGVSLGQARKVCETAAEDIRKQLGLSAEYRLTWLQELPAAR